MAKRKQSWLHSRVVIWSLTALSILILLYNSFGLMAIGYFIDQRHVPIQFGASFSTKYAGELGLNWQQTYQAMLTDLNVKQIRLMSYWDSYQPQVDRYNFKDLDWQMAQAANHHAHVILVVGLRQPRWPECHMPSWAQNLPETDQFEALLHYVTVVVERYKGSPALGGWQIENEASNRYFGRCPSFDQSHYTSEYRLVKSLDPGHQIITNVSNQIGLPLLGPFGDQEGFSIYRKVNVPIIGHNRYIQYWFMPPLWHAFRAAFSQTYLNAQPLVDELQAEPWGPLATNNLSLSQQADSMDPSQIVSNVNFALGTGMHDIYLWGVEWWYWRQIKYHDPSLWETAKVIFHASAQ